MRLDKFAPLALMCLTLLLVGCSGELPTYPVPSHIPPEISVSKQHNGSTTQFAPSAEFHTLEGVPGFVWWKVIRTQGTQTPFMLLITPEQRDRVINLLVEGEEFVVTAHAVQYKMSLTQPALGNTVLFLKEIVLQRK